MDVGEHSISPAQEWALSNQGDGTEHPDYLSDDISKNTVERTFCFIDIVSFTKFTRENGPPAALELVDRFRTVTRQVAAARGVRVSKWMGDGAFLVGVKAGPIIALAAHLTSHFKKIGIQMRAGIATGRALLLDGDDYVGEPVNLAAKICAKATTGGILANVDKEELPEWVDLIEEVSIDIRDIGRVGGIFRLEPNSG